MSSAIDFEATALSLMLTCPSGCDCACRGGAMPLDAWEACVTSYELPAQPGRVLTYRDIEMSGAAKGIEDLISATKHLLGRMPTPREMWLLEATIRRIRP